MEKALHLGLRLRRDPRVNGPQVESLVTACACVRALFPPKEEARPSLHLILVSPVLETPSRGSPPPPAVHGEAMHGRPLPIAHIPYFLSAMTEGGRLAALPGAELTGSCVGHSLGAGPSRGGRGQGKTQRVGFQLVRFCRAQDGAGPGGTRSSDCRPMCPRPPGWCPSPCVTIGGDFHSQQCGNRKCQRGPGGPTMGERTCVGAALGGGCPEGPNEGSARDPHHPV